MKKPKMHSDQSNDPRPSGNTELQQVTVGNICCLVSFDLFSAAAAAAAVDLLCSPTAWTVDAGGLQKGPKSLSES